MKNFTINNVSIDEKAKVITFFCNDLQEFAEENLFNEFADENSVPKEYQVSYDLRNPDEVHLLFSLKDTYAPEAQNFREIAQTMLAMKDSKKDAFKFPAYWNKNNRSWYFRY